MPIFFSLKYFLYFSSNAGPAGLDGLLRTTVEGTGSEASALTASQSGSGWSMTEASMPSFVIFIFNCSTFMPIFFSLKYFLYFSSIAGFFGTAGTAGTGGGGGDLV